MKNVILIFAACMMSLVVASCGGSSNSSDKIAQLEDSIARMQTRIENQGTNDLENQETNNNTINDANGNDSETEASANDIVGTYKVIDALNNVWIIKMETDETATVSQEGGNVTHYGSWRYSGPNYGLMLRFSLDDDPQITFPNMKAGLYLSPCIKDGYLYMTESALKAKNPKHRLPIQKIK